MLDAIFVVGTGRSGTHFTLRCLREYSQADDFLGGVEHSYTLRRVALTAMQSASLGWPMTLRYRWLSTRARFARKILLDQHHPNLFHVEQLLNLFPGAVFLYPDRPAVQIVASMLRHAGVSAWYEDIRSGKLDLPYPNDFFGLTSKSEVNSLPSHLLALRRVLAHRRRALIEQQRNPQRFRFLSYVNLVQDRQAEFARVFSTDELAMLGDTIAKEESQAQSMTKYLDVLSPAQISEIGAEEERCRTAAA